MPFPHKTVLITGATSGIGRALAERMIANGIFVIAVGRRRARLDELAAKYGGEKVAVEVYDVSDLESMSAWVHRITAAYPSLDCIVLNAGLQRGLDFTSPSTIDLAGHTEEVMTNYLSPLHMLVHFLPHLQSLQTPASIILLSSALGVIPLPQVGNYCATKAALHTLAWVLRAQLGAVPATQHIRVVEVMPPAVETELHDYQDEEERARTDRVSMPLGHFVEEMWAGLERNDEDEVLVGPIRERLAGVENRRKEGFQMMLKMVRQEAPGAK